MSPSPERARDSPRHRVTVSIRERSALQVIGRNASLVSFASRVVASTSRPNPRSVAASATTCHQSTARRHLRSEHDTASGRGAGPRNRSGGRQRWAPVATGVAPLMPRQRGGLPVRRRDPAPASALLRMRCGRLRV